LTIQNRGKLYLPPQCKSYFTHSTLYTLSTLICKTSQEDVLPLASVEIDCCFTPFEREQLHTIPMQKPLMNILLFVEDLRIVNVKIDGF